MSSQCGLKRDILLFLGLAWAAAGAERAFQAEATRGAAGPGLVSQRECRGGCSDARPLPLPPSFVDRTITARSAGGRRLAGGNFPQYIRARRAGHEQDRLFGARNCGRAALMGEERSCGGPDGRAHPAPHSGGGQRPGSVPEVFPRSFKKGSGTSPPPLLRGQVLRNSEPDPFLKPVLGPRGRRGALPAHRKQVMPAEVSL